MQYYPIQGTLRETSEPASPYSFFSLTRRHGLREMWDEEHAKFYGREKKHDVADYIKPLGLVRDAHGDLFVRCRLVDAIGLEHVIDIDSFMVQEDAKFVAGVLKSIYGFNVYNGLFSVFAKALNVLRLEPEPAVESEAETSEGSSDVGVSIYQTVDGYPLSGGFLYETHDFNYVDFYHIVDPMTMNDGILAGAVSEVSEVDSEVTSLDDMLDNEEGIIFTGNDSGTAAGGENTGNGDDDDNDASAGDAQAVPQPELVLHRSGDAKLSRHGAMLESLSEEEE